MTSAVVVEVLDLDGAEFLRPAWHDLAARCLEPSIFAEASFVLAAARHLSHGAKPVVIAVWLGAVSLRLIGVVPVSRAALPWLGPARVWTHPQAVAAIPLLDEEHASEAWQAMLEAVGALPGRPAALLLAGLAVGGGTWNLVERCGRVASVFDQRPRAVLLPGSVNRGLGSKPRKELRRQWNRLAELGPLVFTAASDPDAVARALERFLALEAKGWKGSRGTALGSQPETRAFARAALGDLASRGQVDVVSLDLADAPIAMGIVLRSGHHAFFWKTAYDEELARFSPGLQFALRLTDQLAADRQLSRVDSCAIPGHSMIDRVWTARIAVADLLVVTGQEPTARFGWARQAEQLRRSLRQHGKRLRGALTERRR